jgi:acetoin utilization deacetylase AcuC-like enzyme
MGQGHPESPMRLAAINTALQNSDFKDALLFSDAPLARVEQIYLAHDKTYVDAIFSASPDKGTVMLDPDTSMNSYSLNAARRACGAVIHAVDQVMAGEHIKAFCSVRPPGHHAEHKRAMGFCIFNNIAVGAAYAMHSHGIKKVAIVDFDVHHGNGTEDIFKDNPAVMLCSSFQHPFYPHMGSTTRSSHIINLPLPAGTDGHAYRNAVEMSLLPALNTFQPELIMFSAGFDAHEDDPLAGLKLIEDDYYWITSEVKKIADKYAGGKIVSVLEGGYNLDALASSVVSHLRAMV